MSSPVDYGNAFLDLQEAIVEKDINKMRLTAKKTLDFARVLKQPHLEIAVLNMTASGFLSAGQLSTTLKVYEEAAKIAEAATANEAETEMYEQLTVQIMLYKGSALLMQKPPQYETITEAYQEAADKIQKMMVTKETVENKDMVNGGFLYHYLFEALRIMGFCQEQIGRNQAALKHYIKAVSTFEKMSPEVRESAAGDTVGKALLALCRKLSMKKEYFIVIDKMNGFLGEGWEKEKPKK